MKENSCPIGASGRVAAICGVQDESAHYGQPVFRESKPRLGERGLKRGTGYNRRAAAVENPGNVVGILGVRR